MLPVAFYIVSLSEIPIPSSNTFGSCGNGFSMTGTCQTCTDHAFGGSSVKYMQCPWDCDITADEEDLIIRLHKLLGDRWALIAGRLPWRRAEDIENFWKIRSQESECSD
eukprot:Gb_41522 [translate_table: standard]